MEFLAFAIYGGFLGIDLCRFSRKCRGKINEAYDMFMTNLGVIPRPLRMMSASPAIFSHQLQRIQYYTDHSTLSFAPLANIRYLVPASDTKSNYARVTIRT